ncbi:interleukin-21 isoform X2 [Anabas testudineus]|nr:interleukin-21 isoform X2 [Anabas testudineus]
MTTVSAKSTQLRKLGEVLRELNDVKDILQNTEKMINTPPQDIEDCCYASALQCFRSNLELHFNAETSANRKLKKLFKSLRNQLTVKALDSNSESNSTCQACDLHPKVNGREFFNRLETLIQRVSVHFLFDTFDKTYIYIIFFHHYIRNSCLNVYSSHIR